MPTEVIPALSFPWLSALVAAPLLGALVAWRLGDVAARRVGVAFTIVALVLAIGAAIALGPRAAAHDALFLTIDELSRVLLPFAALLFGVVVLAVPRRGAGAVVRRALLVEAIVLATFACRSDVALAVLWVLGVAPLVADLRRRRARAVIAYLVLSAALFVAAVAVRRLVGDTASARVVSDALLLAAILTRKGIVPLHSWTPVLFERGALPAATLFCMPQIGTYAAARLLAPDAPAWLLQTLGAVSLFTGVYGAGLALVQKEGRRAFGFLFMSQSALTVAGLECTSTTALAGGLSIWLSSSLALAGLAMTLHVLEARRGDVSLARWHGGWESTPWLAASFLLLGLASVGFPGTLGFVGAELLVDGSVAVHPYVGAAVIVSSVLNGIVVLKLYLRLFCGRRTPVNPALHLRLREHLAFAVLAAVLVGTGLAPRALVRSRGLAAERLMDERSAAP